MKIIVYNDGYLVFDGDSSVFIKDNDGDEEVAEMVKEAADKGVSERHFISGEWCVHNMEESDV